MERVYIYVVDRDFGFAPNPFHGVCTLATCKPAIRNTARAGDWVIGVGGGRLKASGRCIFAMKITQKLTFNEYWTSPEFSDKKPVRNGSKRMLLGDNIYFQNPETGDWSQAHSHHSHPDGSLNKHNLERDTKSSYVLISNHFYYFGSAAPAIPERFFTALGYKNGIGHRVYDLTAASDLLGWLQQEYGEKINLVQADPFNFDQGDAHYSVDTNRIQNAAGPEA